MQILHVCINILIYYIGIVFAYFAYRQYHPSLASDECHEPYEPRIKRPEDLFPTSNNDIEMAASCQGICTFSS
jgi:hypothetical protein